MITYIEQNPRNYVKQSEMFEKQFGCEKVLTREMAKM
jgi:hypothetical protein